MSGRSRLDSSLLFVAALLLAGPGARGQEKPSCRACEWRQCVENSIKQKEALVEVYEGLGKWAGKQKPPGAILDLEELLTQEARRAALADLGKKFDAFAKQEEKATGAVAAPAGCGLSSGAAIEIETDSVACQIDLGKADAAKKALPCKELWEIAMQHETLHLNRCNQRKGGKLVATKLLTPFGKAREEIAGYQHEIAELEKLLSDGTVEVEATVTVRGERGTVTVSTQGAIPFTIDEKGQVQGTAQQTIAVDVSGLGCSATVVPDEVQYRVAGTKKEESLTLWSVSPAPPIVSLQLVCPEGPATTPVPYHLLVRQTFEYKDRAKIELDLGRVTGGVASGKVLYTLRLCRPQRR